MMSSKPKNNQSFATTGHFGLVILQIIFYQHITFFPPQDWLPLVWSPLSAGRSVAREWEAVPGTGRVKNNSLLKYFCTRQCTEAQADCQYCRLCQ